MSRQEKESEIVRLEALVRELDQAIKQWEHNETEVANLRNYRATALNSLGLWRTL